MIRLGNWVAYTRHPRVLVRRHYYCRIGRLRVDPYITIGRLVIGKIDREL